MTQAEGQTSSSKCGTDWFIVSVFSANVDITDDSFSFLADAAEAFLRCRGNLSWNEWLSLSQTSRMAFVEAANRMERAEQMFLADAIAEAVNNIAEAKMRKVLADG